MLIEEKLAIGSVVIRVITRKPDKELIDYLSERKYRYTNVDADSDEGKVNVLFTVVKRDNLKEMTMTIKKFNPNAFYTVEGVKKDSDVEVADERGFLFRSKFLSKA